MKTFEPTQHEAERLAKGENVVRVELPESQPKLSTAHRGYWEFKSLNPETGKNAVYVGPLKAVVGGALGPYVDDTDKQTTTLVRLHEISAGDIRAQDVEFEGGFYKPMGPWKAFGLHWNTRNPQNPYDSNPWVWRVEVRA